MEDNTSSVAQPTARDAKSKLKPSEVLSKAADLIKPEGAWRQYSYGDESEGRCLVGALSAVAPGDMIWGDLTAPLKAVVGRFGLINWNDTPGRTQAEVVAALRKAAELAKAEGQ